MNMSWCIIGHRDCNYIASAHSEVGRKLTSWGHFAVDECVHERVHERLHERVQMYTSMVCMKDPVTVLGC